MRALPIPKPLRHRVIAMAAGVLIGPGLLPVPCDAGLRAATISIDPSSTPARRIVPGTIDPIGMVSKSSSIRGWYSGVATDSEDTLRFCQFHHISPMNEIYPFEKAQEAYDRMMSGKARFRGVLKMR